MRIEVPISVVLMLALMAGSVAAVTWISSNYSTVTVVNPAGYALSLDPTDIKVVVGDTINFTAYLTQEGTGVEGATIHLYCENTDTGIAAVTNSTGYAILPCTVDTEGVYDFQAKYQLAP